MNNILGLLKPAIILYFQNWQTSVSFRFGFENSVWTYFFLFFSLMLPYLPAVLNHCVFWVCSWNAKCHVLFLEKLLYVFVCSSFRWCPEMEAACFDKVRLERWPLSLNKKARRPEHAISLDSPGIPSHRKGGGMNAIDLK